MDSRHLFGYGVTGADLSVTSHPSVPSIPARLFDSLKLDSKNSPKSPFSSHFDSETQATLSNSPDEYSSTDNLSCTSPSCNSSFESNSHFRFENATAGPNVRYTLQELETALMGPDEDEQIATPGQRSISQSPGAESSRMSRSQLSDPAKYGHPSGGSQTRMHLYLQGVPPGNLKQLLIECARALAENRLDDFEKLKDKAWSMVSISGEPIQRLGAYMIECLVARKESSGTNIYHTLKCNKPAGPDLLTYMHILYEICPYLKFGYMAANGAIADACKNEDRIHIIDFQIAQGTQWDTLLKALATRPSGPPKVRITGIDDPVSQYARGDSLELVGRRLAALSEESNISVEFNPVPVFAPEITKEMLNVQPGEALAVNFPLQLHHTPDESVDVNNPRDGLLRMVKSLSPKVVTLVEQESNTNTAPFLARFVEALDYYSAMFESIDVTLPRDRRERINVEQHCLARDIVNIIACEGKERVERHELLGKWKLRFMMAGFRPYPLSSYVNSVIRGLLRRYSEHYSLVETDGAMLLGWKDRNLVSASAWH